MRQLRAEKVVKTLLEMEALLLVLAGLYLISKLTPESTNGVALVSVRVRLCFSPRLSSSLLSALVHKMSGYGVRSKVLSETITLLRVNQMLA